jgi:hypothetical protein
MRNLALSLALIAGLFVPMGTIHYLPTNRQKVVAQFRRGNRGSRRAKHRCRASISTSREGLSQS